MTTNDNDKKGFGGFNDLVSDVTKEVEASIKKPVPKAAKPITEAPPKTQQESPSRPTQSQKPTQTHNSQNIPGGNSGSNWGWWVVGIFFIIAIAAGSGEKRIEEPAAPASYQQTYNDSDSPSTSPEVLPEPAPAPVEISNSEETPPVGTGLIFSHNQIRYCLAEDVRLSTIKESLDSYSQ